MKLRKNQLKKQKNWVNKPNSRVKSLGHDNHIERKANKVQFLFNLILKD
jgi:hypothetical protein